MSIFLVSFSGFFGGIMFIFSMLSVFSGVMIGFEELLEGNLYVADVFSSDELSEEVMLYGVFSEDIYMLMWGSEVMLVQKVNELIEDVWSSIFGLEVKLESIFLDGRAFFFFLDMSFIVWKYLMEGMCLLDLFSGISSGLVAVFLTDISVYRYLYVESDKMVQGVLLSYVVMLVVSYSVLLLVGAVSDY